MREGAIVTDQAFGQMTYDFVVGGFFERAKSKRLTGERIIFCPHEGQNFYLSLSLHDEPDEAVYYKLALNCSEEFPFIFDHQRALNAWQLMERNPEKYQQSGPFILSKPKSDCFF